MTPTRLSLAFLLLTTFIAAGCDNTANAPADLASIDLGAMTVEVIKPSSKSINAGTIGPDPEKTSAMLGDVTVEISAAQNGPRSLTINGKQYGFVTDGDKVVVNEARDVTVNGTTRQESTQGNPAKNAATDE